MNNTEKKRKAPAYYHAPFLDLVEELAEEYSWSVSEVLRWLAEGEVEEEGGKLSKDDLLERIDDTKIKLARREKRQEKIQAEQELREWKHSFEDRVKGYFRDRLHGDAAYEPEAMDDLSKGYKDDAENWSDDAANAKEKKELVDKLRKVYRAGYYARNHAEQIDSELDPKDRDKDWLDIGEDLFKLRSRSEEVVEHIRSVADNQGVGWDSDAVIDSVCNRWSVGPASVMLLMEQMVAGENDRIHDMLRKGGDAVADPTDHNRALTNGHNESEPEVSIPTEPTENMIEIAIEKYRTTGSVDTARIGLENKDSVECSLPQAKRAAEIAQDRVDGETVSTEEVS